MHSHIAVHTLPKPQELRDLVRSLGRGGGWGPLRRAPVQYLDFNARPGGCAHAHGFSHCKPSSDLRTAFTSSQAMVGTSLELFTSHSLQTQAFHTKLVHSKRAMAKRLRAINLPSTPNAVHTKPVHSKRAMVKGLEY
jgi:hypothetical protein